MSLFTKNHRPPAQAVTVCPVHSFFVNTKQAENGNLIFSAPPRFKSRLKRGKMTRRESRIINLAYIINIHFMPSQAPHSCRHQGTPIFGLFGTRPKAQIQRALMSLASRFTMSEEETQLGVRQLVYYLVNISSLTFYKPWRTGRASNPNNPGTQHIKG